MPESITLDRLHDAIQIAFGWTDSHLHQFEIDGEQYGPHGDWADTRHETIRLSSLVEVGERLHYVYDFGDNSRHTIQLERRLSSGSEEDGARCLGGRRAGPPANCGGIDA